MSTLLKNLKITRVDLVDIGANLDPVTGDGAHVVLWKRAEGAPLMPDQPTTDPTATLSDDELLDAALDDVNLLVTDLAADAEAVEKRGAKISADRMSKLKGIHKTLGSILKEAAPAPAPAPAGDVSKAADPAPTPDPTPEPQGQPSIEDVDQVVEKFVSTGDEALIAKFADQPVVVSLAKRLRDERVAKDAALAQAANERDARELRDIAETLGKYDRIAVNLDKDTAVFKRAKASLSAEDYARLHELLAGANAVAKGAAPTTAVGSSQADGVDLGTDAFAEIQRLAGEMVSKGATKTHAEAIAKVCADHPDLYARHVAEQRARSNKD